MNYYTMQLEWKEFSVNLANLASHMKENYSSYLGCSANSKLELHFSEQPSDEESAAILDHWESLDGSDYVSAAQLADQAAELAEAISAAKVGLLSKTWDQMSTVERKIVMNMEVSRADMGLE